MNLGIITTAASSYQGEDFPEAMARIAAAGYEGVMYYQAGMFTGGNIDRVRESLANEGLRLMSVHSEWPVFFAGTEARRREAFEEVARWFDYADQLAAENIVVHPCSEVAELPVSERAAAVNCYCEGIQELAERYPHLPVAVENMIGGKAKMYAAAWPELASLVERINLPNVGYCLDTGHAMTTGVFPGDMAANMGGRLLTTHLHDNHGDRDEHLRPGEGIIDWRATLKAVTSANRDASLVIELNLKETDKTDEKDFVQALSDMRTFLASCL